MDYIQTKSLEKQKASTLRGESAHSRLLLVIPQITYCSALIKDQAIMDAEALGVSYRNAMANGTGAAMCQYGLGRFPGRFF